MERPLLLLIINSSLRSEVVVPIDFRDCQRGGPLVAIGLPQVAGPGLKTLVERNIKIRTLITPRQRSPRTVLQFKFPRGGPQAQSRHADAPPANQSTVRRRSRSSAPWDDISQDRSSRAREGAMNARLQPTRFVPSWSADWPVGRADSQEMETKAYQSVKNTFST